MHYVSEANDINYTDPSSSMMVLFNIDPSDWTKFKDGYITVIADTSLEDSSSSPSILGPGYINETKKYVKQAMPDMYSDSSIYTIAFKQNIWPQDYAGEAKTVDTSFAFIDGSISVESDIRLRTDWLNNDVSEGYDIMIPRWTTLIDYND